MFVAELAAVLIFVLVLVTLYRLALTVVSAVVVKSDIEFVVKIVRSFYSPKKLKIFPSFFGVHIFCNSFLHSGFHPLYEFLSHVCVVVG